jgi:nucleotide-binding universal stress UspA family protein
MSPSRVVVGVNATAGSFVALAWAMNECRLRDAELVLTHAIDGADAELAAACGSPHASADSAARTLVELHRGVIERIAPDITVTADVGPRSPVDTLLDAAEKADLVVLGSRGPAGFALSELGSIAHRVAVHARCPVAIVPPASAYPRWLHPQRVVVGLADTRTGARAVDYAVTHARRTGSQLQLVRASGIASGGRAGAEKQLEVVRERIARHAPQLVVTTLASDRNPVDVLLKASREADLVVLGSRHTGDRWTARIGSVPAALLARAECPVVLVG